MHEDLRPFRDIHDAKFKIHPSAKPFNVIKELRGNPNLVVKESTDRTWWGKETDKIKKIKLIDDYIALLQAPEIGIAEHVPHTRLVLGQIDKYRENVFTIQDRIEGDFISSSQAIDAFKNDPEGEIANAVREIGRIVKGIVKTYITTFNGEEGKSIEIISPRNFLYGINLAKPEMGKKVYLIDFVPIYEDEPMHMKNELREFLEKFPMLQPMLAEEIKELEDLQNKVGQPKNPQP